MASARAQAERSWRPGEFRWPDRVASSDTATGGLMVFGAYSRWIELAEVELWRDAGIPMGEMVDRFGWAGHLTASPARS